LSTLGSNVIVTLTNKNDHVVTMCVNNVSFEWVHFLLSLLENRPTTMLCRLVGGDPCPKLELQYVNSQLCEHAKVAVVAYHT
jgi:hypothetical protein